MPGVRVGSSWRKYYLCMRRSFLRSRSGMTSAEEGHFMQKISRSKRTRAWKDTKCLKNVVQAEPKMSMRDEAKGIWDRLLKGCPCYTNISFKMREFLCIFCYFKIFSYEKFKTCKSKQHNEPNFFSPSRFSNF